MTIKQILVSKEDIASSKEHTFSVFFDGESYQTFYPEPLSELNASFPDESLAYMALVHDYINQPFGYHWALDEPEKCAAALWSELGDIPVNEDDEIEQPFLDFEAGTDKTYIWHWFEEAFDITLHDLMYKEEDSE